MGTPHDSHDHHAQHEHEHEHGHHHGHHGHHHHHGLTAGKAIAWALLLNAIFLGVELGVGWWSGSLALLSDAAHMVSDVGSLVLALAAVQVATRVATPSTTYGLARAEVLGAFLNGLLLVGAAAWIVGEAVRRLYSGAPHVEGLPVLLVGVAGLALNLGSAWVLHKADHGADHGNLNVRGALLHMLADALGSGAAIVAAVLLMLGIPGADPVVSLLVAVLVAIGAVRLLRDAGRVLLELPPVGFDVPSVRTALGGIDGVVEVHDLHAWSLDGRTALVSAHLVIEDGARSDGVCRSARAMLGDKFGVGHATLQVEPADGQCQTRCGEETHP
jgi:cobalt-zinc-cadmium efflux system protein